MSVKKYLTSVYLLQESILPEPEHHHVRPVSGTKGSEKVLWERERRASWPRERSRELVVVFQIIMGLETQLCGGKEIKRKILYMVSPPHSQSNPLHLSCYFPTVKVV